MPDTARSRLPADAAKSGLRRMYLALSERAIEPDAAEEGARWLREQLDADSGAGSGLPHGAEQFAAWSAAHAEAVGKEYKQYLAERKAGAPRRYFSSKAHALYFLKGVAPTKLVDGAWLYGLLRHWDQGAMRPLITTYLEELGNGVPEKNHVLLFQQQLDAHGGDQWQGLSEEHFVQGLIQLALAYNADQFLPELIGYNLGYEQLPLHLLITAYELNELGIDPYYFTLHVRSTTPTPATRARPGKRCKNSRHRSATATPSCAGWKPATGSASWAPARCR